MEYLEISWPSHRDYLYDQIYELFNAETGFDFELLLANGEKSAVDLNVHSLILKIFCQSLISCDQQFRLEGEDIKRDDVRCLLEFIYRGRTFVELKRFEAVKKVAKQLQLKSFTDLVEGIEIENVQVVCLVEDNCITQNETEKSIVNVVDKDKSDEMSKFNIVPKVASKENLNKFIDSLGEDSGKTSKIKAKKIQLYSNDNLVPKNSVEGELNVKMEQKMGDKSKLIKVALEKKEIERKLLSLENLINSCESYMKQSEDNLTCFFCKKQFQTFTVFRKHQKSHAEADKCSHCPYKGRKLKLHLALKHQMNLNGELLEKSIKCELCEYTCTMNSILKAHRKESHTECVSLKCDVCNFFCANLSDLNRHKRVKHSEKIACEMCGKKCNRYSIKKHLELHDDVERLKKFKCTLCNFLSRYRFNLKVHFKKIHGKSEGEIDSLLKSDEVKVSQDELISNDNLQGSIRRCFKGRKKTERRRRVIGEAAKKKVCEICGLVLSGWSTLYRHKRLHREGDSLRRRYQCPECVFRTREKFNLRVHCVKKHEMSFEQFNSLNINSLIVVKPTENVTVEAIQVETEIASSSISVNCVDLVRPNV